MAGIIYTAVDRGGKLITDSPAHAPGVAYSIDVKLRAYSQPIEAPKTAHISLAGSVETELKRVVTLADAVFIFPDSKHADVEEWLYSVSAGEVFSLDPYGTIASPNDAQDVVCMNKSFSFGRMSHGSTPWRSVGMALRSKI